VHNFVPGHFGAEFKLLGFLLMIQGCKDATPCNYKRISIKEWTSLELSQAETIYYIYTQQISHQFQLILIAATRQHKHQNQIKATTCGPQSRGKTSESKISTVLYTENKTVKAEKM